MYTNPKGEITIKKKVFLIVAFLILIFGLYKFSDGLSSYREVDEAVNETYYEYVSHPDKFVETQATIVSYTKFESEDGIEFLLTDESYVTVELALPDGSLVQTDILRDKEDKIGNTISIAYRKDDDEVLRSYMNATKLHFVENYKMLFKMKCLIAGDIICLIALFSYIIYNNVVYKKRNNFF